MYIIRFGYNTEMTFMESYKKISAPFSFGEFSSNDAPMDFKPDLYCLSRESKLCGRQFLL